MMNMNPYFEAKRMIPGEIPYPFSCFTTSSEGKLYVPPHWHDYIEIIYVMKGRMKVLSGNEYYDIESGGLVMFDSREVHSTRIYADTETRCIVLKFEPDVFSSIGPLFEIRYIIPFINPGFKHQKIFEKKELATANLPYLLENILDEYEHKRYGFELAVKAGIYNIFLWILRNRYPADLKLQLQRLYNTIDMHVLHEILKYVEQRHAEEITISVMAKRCNLSYSYFSRQFKKIMGRTFKEYLNFIRINEAEKLLLTADINITEVALKCGFNHSSYFIKQFKKYKQISPKQFQRNYSKE